MRVCYITQVLASSSILKEIHFRVNVSPHNYDKSKMKTMLSVQKYNLGVR